MVTVDQFVGMLLHLLRDPERKEMVEQFQRCVWDTEKIAGEPARVLILRELAYDLGFFEPDKVLRGEDSRYFDSQQLVHVIRVALAKLMAQ